MVGSLIRESRYPHKITTEVAKKSLKVPVTCPHVTANRVTRRRVTLTTNRQRPCNSLFPSACAAEAPLWRDWPVVQLIR